MGSQSFGTARRTECVESSLHQPPRKQLHLAWAVHAMQLHTILNTPSCNKQISTSASVQASLPQLPGTPIPRRLLDRLGEFAQFDKQRALGLLERRLLQLSVSSTQYDFTHRLLAFLYCSSRGAIHSEYKGSALVEKLIQQEQTAGKRCQRVMLVFCTGWGFPLQGSALKCVCV